MRHLPKAERVTNDENMRTEKQKMLAGELYEALDPELVEARPRFKKTNGDVSQEAENTRFQQIGTSTDYIVSVGLSPVPCIIPCMSARQNGLQTATIRSRKLYPKSMQFRVQRMCSTSVFNTSDDTADDKTLPSIFASQMAPQRMAGDCPCRIAGNHFNCR
jgi:hypothetical protein